MKNKGVFYALGAYFLWGILPIYWKQLNHVPATQAFGSRIVSCFLILILLITLRKEWPAFKAGRIQSQSTPAFPPHRPAAGRQLADLHLGGERKPHR